MFLLLSVLFSCPFPETSLLKSGDSEHTVRYIEFITLFINPVAESGIRLNTGKTNLCQYRRIPHRPITHKYHAGQKLRHITKLLSGIHLYRKQLSQRADVQIAPDYHDPPRFLLGKRTDRPFSRHVVQQHGLTGVP